MSVCGLGESRDGCSFPSLSKLACACRIGRFEREGGTEPVTWWTEAWKFKAKFLWNKWWKKKRRKERNLTWKFDFCRPRGRKEQDTHLTRLCNTEEEGFSLFGFGVCLHYYFFFFAGWKRNKKNPPFNPGFILLSESRAKTSGVLRWGVIKNSSLNNEGFTKQILLLLIYRLLQACSPLQQQNPPPSAVPRLRVRTFRLLPLFGLLLLRPDKFPIY